MSLLPTGPAGDHMKISTRKYCVDRGGESLRMKLHVYNACVNFRLVLVLILCTVYLAVRPSAYKSVTSHIY